MAFWKKQHPLRGNFLEECINVSNKYYMETGLGVVQKIPTSITPVEMDQKNGRITLAYFEKKSTVDYIGNIQGIPVCFDAKETQLNYLPLSNIHEHQIAFMEAFDKQDGLAFLIVKFTELERIYLLPMEDLKKYWDQSKNGGRKSIPLEAFKEKYRIYRSGNILVHYLTAVQSYLMDK